MNIAAQLLNRARQYPDMPAITADGHTVTFAELARSVTSIAGALRQAHGVRQGDRVLLWMENRREFVEALFACWVAGACAVPVNPKLHGKEVLHMLRDSGAVLVLTTMSLAPLLRTELDTSCGTAALIVADDQAYASMTTGDGIPCCDTAPTDPAWIFYTSGTTGFPKGAVLTHRNLLSIILAYYADIEQVEPGQTMLHAAPLSHGSGQYMLPHLLGGGHQVILQKFDPFAMLADFTRYEAVSLFAVPTMVMRLVQAAKMPGGGVLSNPPGNLRTLIYGGAPMYVSDLLQALDVFGPRFFQLYAQGESAMTISGLRRSGHEGLRDAAHLARLASSGVPRSGVEIRVVDMDGRDLPVGKLGEVIARSDCVMAGYWNNAPATATALRSGWLWTGDIGSLDELGYLAIRDRSKDMLISGGSNIYPREIEEVLLRHPAVAECSVIGRRHADLGEEPVAFVVLREGQSINTDELDVLCLQHIARYKRPREYRFIAALPKSTYGKTLKTALRDLLDSTGPMQGRQT